MKLSSLGLYQTYTTFLVSFRRPCHHSSWWNSCQLSAGAPYNSYEHVILLNLISLVLNLKAVSYCTSFLARLQFFFKEGSDADDDSYLVETASWWLLVLILVFILTLRLFRL